MKDTSLNKFLVTSFGNYWNICNHFFAADSLEFCNRTLIDGFIELNSSYNPSIKISSVKFNKVTAVSIITKLISFFKSSLEHLLAVKTQDYLIFLFVKNKMTNIVEDRVLSNADNKHQLINNKLKKIKQKKL